MNENKYFIVHVTRKRIHYLIHASLEWCSQRVKSYCCIQASHFQHLITSKNLSTSLVLWFFGIHFIWTSKLLQNYRKIIFSIVFYFKTRYQHNNFILIIIFRENIFAKAPRRTQFSKIILLFNFWDSEIILMCLINLCAISHASNMRRLYALVRKILL